MNELESKIIDIEKITEITKTLKKNGRKIVFTNGCFDIIHRGHIEYLFEAKKLGDILIVGLNSDKSVKIIKGDKRPIISEKDRAVVLSSIRFVDYVVIFDDETPKNLIRNILPDVLVKGGDWKLEEIVGRNIVEKNGGKCLALPFKQGYSTTQIIKRIKNL